MLILFLELPGFLFHYLTIRRLFHIKKSCFAHAALLFISALHRAGVSAEFHMYPRGVHGLSLANRLSLDQAETALQEECASWISLVHTWIEGRFQTITLRQGEQT